MRPLLLEFRGFGAFRQPTVVDFADTDVFALTGPTGSGKSTVVDAICFALYGTVPRYGDERAVAPVMSVGHQETAVRLAFEVGGRRYVAARVVRRDRHGRVTTKEARLEGDDGQELAGRASDMAVQVEALLGLPFAHFTRCVVLPQGEFARFLHDRPADRQALVVRLLDLGVYERMAKEANRRAAEASAKARLCEQQAAARAAATPDAVAAAVRRAEQLAQLVAGLQAAAPEVAQALAAAEAASARAAEAGAAVAALGRIQVPAAARQAGRAVDEAAEAAAGAEERQAAALAGHEAASAALAALPPLAELRVAVAAHAELAAAQGELAAAHEAGRRAAEAEAVAASACEQAEGALAVAEAGHEQARAAYAARLLAERLVAGEACPVCGRTVDLAPHPVAPTDGLADARAAAAQAREAAARERAGLEQARADHAGALARADQVAQRVERLGVAVASHPEPAELDALVARVEAAVAAEQAAAQAERHAAQTAARARAAVEAARRAAADLAAGYHAQRDPVAALGPPPPSEHVVASWQALAAWAEQVRPQHVAASQEADALARAARVAHAELVAGLARRAAAAGVEVPADPDVGVLQVAAARAEAQAAQVAAALARDLAEAERLRTEQAEAEDRAAVAGELGRLLSARGFERWLVAEALQRLAEGASGTLLRLSGRQFSLLVGADGEFAVVDHANGDEVRPVRSLSGGETFQASLALALALADELAGLASGGAARLEAIFLDEGFGSLDADSLETVAATIEALGTSGRMVGIVTHVAELAARVPVRYEVRRGPTTATVERRVG